MAYFGDEIRAAMLSPRSSGSDDRVKCGRIMSGYQAS